MEWIALAIFLGLTGGGSAIYFPARKEWNDTFKRAARTLGTNIRVVGKDQQALTHVQSKKEISAMFETDWDTKFTGGNTVAVIDKNRHVIVRSWSSIKTTYDEGQRERWHWKCSCGEEDSHVVKGTATYHAIRHVNLWQGRDETGVLDNNWHKNERKITR